MTKRSKTYIQINIYDSNLLELKDAGIDLNYLLDEVGLSNCWIGEIPFFGNNEQDCAISTCSYNDFDSFEFAKFPRCSTPIMHHGRIPLLETINGLSRIPSRNTNITCKSDVDTESYPKTVDHDEVRFVLDSIIDTIVNKFDQSQDTMNGLTAYNEFDVARDEVRMVHESIIGEDVNKTQESKTKAIKCSKSQLNLFTGANQSCKVKSILKRGFSETLPNKKPTGINFRFSVRDYFDPSQNFLENLDKIRNCTKISKENVSFNNTSCVNSSYHSDIALNEKSIQDSFYSIGEYNNTEHDKTVSIYNHNEEGSAEKNEIWKISDNHTNGICNRGSDEGNGETGGTEEENFENDKEIEISLEKNDNGHNEQINYNTDNINSMTHKEVADAGKMSQIEVYKYEGEAIIGGLMANDKEKEEENVKVKNSIVDTDEMMEDSELISTDRQQIQYEVTNISRGVLQYEEEHESENDEAIAVEDEAVERTLEEEEAVGGNESIESMSIEEDVDRGISQSEGHLNFMETEDTAAGMNIASQGNIQIYGGDSKSFDVVLNHEQIPSDSEVNNDENVKNYQDTSRVLVPIDCEHDDELLKCADSKGVDETAVISPEGGENLEESLRSNIAEEVITENQGGLKRKKVSFKDYNENIPNRKLMTDYEFKKALDRQFTIKCEFEGCGRSYKWKHRYGKLRLIDHALTHCENKLLNCRLCTYKTNTTRSIRRHYQKNHCFDKSLGFGMKELLSIPIGNQDMKTLWLTCFKGSINIIGEARSETNYCDNRIILKRKRCDSTESSKPIIRKRQSNDVFIRIS